MQAPALRPAGKPGRESGSELSLFNDTALPQAPPGPRAAVRDCKRTGAGRPWPRRERTRCFPWPPSRRSARSSSARRRSTAGACAGTCS